MHGYARELAVYPAPDPEKAKALLAEAGYPDGFRLTLHSTNDRYVNDEAISIAVAGFLGRIGIQVTVVAQPIALHGVTVSKLESDFYLYGWGVSTYDSAYIFDFLVATRGSHGRGAQNGTGYSNPALDAQIVSLSTETDSARREATIRAIWETVQAQRFYIALHDQLVHFASIQAIDVPVHPDNKLLFKEVSWPAAKR